MAPVSRTSSVIISRESHTKSQHSKNHMLVEPATSVSYSDSPKGTAANMLARSAKEKPSNPDPFLAVGGI